MPSSLQTPQTLILVLYAYCLHVHLYGVKVDTRWSANCGGEATNSIAIHVLDVHTAYRNDIIMPSTLIAN